MNQTIICFIYVSVYKFDKDYSSVYPPINRHNYRLIRIYGCLETFKMISLSVHLCLYKLYTHIGENYQFAI